MAENAEARTNDPTDPGSANRAKGTNPTPLDVIFILFASIALLLFLLWVLPNGQVKYSNAPPFLRTMVQSVWGKLSFAGGSAVALMLRRFLSGSPAPNYLLWIPSCMGMLIVALFLLSKVMPPDPIHAVQMNASFRLDKPLSEFASLHRNDVPAFKLWETHPKPGASAVGVYYVPSPDPRFPYPGTLAISSDEGSEAFIKLTPAEGDTREADDTWDYKACLHSIAMQLSQLSGSTIKIDCANEVCVPSKDDGPGYVASGGCGDSSVSGGLSLPTVLAAEETSRLREPGWDVPSVQTLEKMKDSQRVGYTLFDVSFTLQGATAQADSYYYALRVNDQPVYIDGLSPGLEPAKLQQGTKNYIEFGLENLNFTGQYDGYEKLHLTIYFVTGNTVIYRQDMERDYIALRDAASEPPLQSAAGTFQWTGTYKPANNENKYEILLSSADCGDPPSKNCLDRAEYAKKQFDKGGLLFQEKPAVMVVRPPLRTPAAYGLALGLVQPTSQVQFTFNAEEASQVCHWAAGQAGQGKAGRLIQADLRRYEVATRGYAPCK